IDRTSSQATAFLQQNAQWVGVVTLVALLAAAIRPKSAAGSIDRETPRSGPAADSGTSKNDAGTEDGGLKTDRAGADELT
ncbi:MAG: hypothetical protein R3246_13080, partial [Acidimicrobiia bacterium]|nr:hypothetical protein [Acidimicrobiia bacterium]